MNYIRYQPHIYKHIIKAKLLMDRSFDQPINLDQMAETCHLSKFHFNRLFKSIYRVTPGSYLINVRILYAKKLLSKGGSTPEVCHAVGYESLGSFKSLFKKHAGKTPSEFRSEQQRLNSERGIPGCFYQKSKIEDSR